jgi:hypothetical protein
MASVEAVRATHLKPHSGHSKDAIRSSLKCGMFTRSMVVVPWGQAQRQWASNHLECSACLPSGLQWCMSIAIWPEHSPQPQFLASCAMLACARLMRWLYALTTANG